MVPGILVTSHLQKWISSPAAWSEEQDRADKWMQDGLGENPE
jgi:hypothetical protein